MAFGTVSTDVIQTSDGLTIGAGNATLIKNKLINGDMRIDQRNAGALVNPAVDSTCYLDRWLYQGSQTSKFSIGQNAGSVTPPTGFTNYLGLTSLSAYSVTSTDYFALVQRIEGFNIADLGWGAANAKTVTLSFWVYSSLTGTFGASLINGSTPYTYPFTYTISAANTWQQISVTIAGPTAGTWVTNNGTGIGVRFVLGCGSTFQGTANTWALGNYLSVAGATNVVGTNGATFYITGCQLERGSSATGFEYVNYQTSLANCQRYYEKSYDYGTVAGTASATSGLSYQCTGRDVSQGYGIYRSQFRVDKRATPTVTLYTLAGTSGKVGSGDSGLDTGNANIYYQSQSGFLPVNNTGGTITNTALSWHYTASAEL